MPTLSKTCDRSNRHINRNEPHLGHKHTHIISIANTFNNVTKILDILLYNKISFCHVQFKLRVKIFGQKSLKGSG